MKFDILLNMLLRGTLWPFVVSFVVKVSEGRQLHFRDLLGHKKSQTNQQKKNSVESSPLY